VIVKRTDRRRRQGRHHLEIVPGMAQRQMFGPEFGQWVGAQHVRRLQYCRLVHGLAGSPGGHERDETGHMDDPARPRTPRSLHDNPGSVDIDTLECIRVGRPKLRDGRAMKDGVDPLESRGNIIRICHRPDLTLDVRHRRIESQVQPAHIFSASDQSGRQMPTDKAPRSGHQCLFTHGRASPLHTSSPSSPTDPAISKSPSSLPRSTWDGAIRTADDAAENRVPSGSSISGSTPPSSSIATMKDAARAVPNQPYR